MILSDRAFDHVSRPRNRGGLEDADRLGISGTPGEGPYVQIWLKCEEGRVLKASYDTNGCPSSIASASALCELATGREMNKLLLLQANDLIIYLGGLPEGKEYYATLAIEALHQGLGTQR